MSLLPNAAVLLGKELRTEFRSRELLTTTFVFILTIIVLFSLTFDPTSDESRRFAPGLLWLAFLFASSLLLTELLLLPFFTVMYNVPVLRVLHWLVLVFFLASLGISIAGTALSAISAQARMRELLLPLLMLPLLTPILVASAEVTRALLDRDPAVLWQGIGFIAVFDVVFLTALWLFGEYLLEE